MISFSCSALLFPVLGFLLAPVLLRAQTSAASEDLARVLAEEVSGEIAYRYTDMISKFDRVQASAGWHEAAVWIKAELERLGYRDVVLEGWPSDGTRRYGTYRSVIGWRAKSAVLWLTSPRRERLCSFEEIPLDPRQTQRAGACGSGARRCRLRIGRGGLSR